MARLMLLAWSPLLAVTASSAQELTLTADDVRSPAFSASGIRIAWAMGTASATVDIARLDVAGQRLERLRLDCRDFRWQASLIECRAGTLRRAGLPALPVSFRYARDSRALSLELPSSGGRWLLSWQEGRAELGAENADIAALASWLPELAAWHLKGRVDGRAVWRGERLSGRLALRDGAFSTDGGNRAGEKLNLALDLSATLAANRRWTWTLGLAWRGGEIYWQPFYLAATGQRLTAAGALDGGALTVTSGTLDLGAIGRIGYAGRWDRLRQRLAAAELRSDGLALAPAAASFLAPLLAQRAWPALTAQGMAAFDLRLAEGAVAALSLRLDNAGLADAGARFAVEGVGGTLNWAREGARASTLAVARARFGALAFDPFSLALTLGLSSLSIPRIEAPLLGSLLIVDDLALDWGRGEWAFGLALHPLSLERLTATLGLPRFAGTLSASIPRVRHAGSLVTLDGALIIQAFDGYFAANDLRLIDPFGRLPRLSADVELRHIDLNMLTTAFSFGRITGYVDGEVKALELAGWQPQAFDARIESAPGDYPRRISQHAVENITALGGASASAAIQRSFLRFFEDFGYSRLGLSCRLEHGVCRMDGIAPAPQGYVIVKGGGVPALNVIGYNRSVDWAELVTRLKRITDRNAVPIIR